ncbi:MAG: hypothetical protein GXY27_02350, partial [Erysipelotrichaceae bacterium]|nr:hypothetical protein [Erysipelotrichaceae bacterium]
MAYYQTKIKKKSRGKRFLVFLSILVVATITIAILVNLNNTSSTNTYTITWENYDGTVLETDSVAYGSTPTYDGATPSKDGTDQYTYTFSGWSPSVVAVTSDATYIAQFSSAINSYTITWENYDGTVLETDSVAYGAMPSYDGATPTREEDEEG